MSRATPRSKWPVAVLRRVVGELSRAAPRHLLARELWAGAASAGDHLRRVRAFTASSAVMSMVRGNRLSPPLPTTLPPH